MRVLFTTTPGRGHVHPMVPLARAFVARGHEVAWATAGDVAAGLRAQGFEAMAAGMEESAGLAEVFRRYPEVQSIPPADRPDVLFGLLFGRVRMPPMLDDLLPIAKAWRPALLVHDQAELAAPLVGAVTGVPSVAHAFGMLLPRARVAAAGEAVAALWEAHGVEPRPYAGTYDHLYLDIYPPSLQATDTGHVPAVQPVRPVTFATAGHEPVPDWLAGPAADPVVYVTFGTVFNRDLGPIAATVEALRELAVRVVVTLGPGRDPRLLGVQPPNVHVAGYIAQTEVLPHCAAVVSHAGSGTFLAALGHGLPNLCLPQAADQFLNAAAAARSGAGIALHPHEVTVDTVRAAARRLLAEPSFRSAARRLADEIGAMPAPGEVAEALAGRFGGQSGSTTPS